MNRTVILSTNDNPAYFSYIPYVRKAWNLFGWKTIIFHLGDQEIVDDDLNSSVNVERIDGVKDETVVQTIRLFGHHYTDGLIMTSDMDMLPMSNYWNPDPDEITCYGTDLTGYKHYPICYIAMNEKNWSRVIPETDLKELLEKYNQHKSQAFNDWWFTDQDIITERLSKEKVNSILRGHYINGMALNRIDRIDWNNTLRAEGIKIDAHLPKVFNENVMNDLMETVRQQTGETND